MSDTQFRSSLASFLRPPAAPRRSLAAAVLALAAVPACGGVEADATAETVVGNRGALEFSATPLAPPAAGPNSFQVRLFERSSGKPLSGAELDVSALMPSMGHEATVAPEVQETEPGFYEVSRVVFSMSGTWEVRYRAASASIQDEAAFRYQVR